MAVRIRLSRLGTKKKPFYRIVVADSEAPRDGRRLEQVGWYDLTQKPSKLKIEVEKVKGWMSKGAKPTRAVENLLKREGVIR